MALRPIRGKDATFFTTQEEIDKLYELAFTGMPIKHIAGHFGCSYQTITVNPGLAAVVAQGHADNRQRLEDETNKWAYLDLRTVDKEDRPFYAPLKQKMLSDLRKAADKDPFVAPVEAERVRRLSDEELEREIAALGSKTTSPVLGSSGSK